MGHEIVNLFSDVDQKRIFSASTRKIVLVNFLEQKRVGSPKFLCVPIFNGA